LLERAIRSVLNQTCQNFEIIVVNDCSTDDTEEIINKFKDRRIRYIRHDRNKGRAASRNAGIRHARGAYITFLDDDDEMLPLKLERQLQKFKECSEKVGLVYCGYADVYGDKIVRTTLPRIKGYVYDSVLLAGPFAIHAPLIRKECLDKSGDFDLTFSTCEDWDLWIRMSRCYEFDFIPEVLALYNMHGDQTITCVRKMISGREMILKKHLRELERRKKILSWHLRRLGSLYCFDGEYVKGRKYLLKSMRVHPMNIGSYFHMLLSFISKRLHKKLIEKYGLTRIEDLNLFF